MKFNFEKLNSTDPEVKYGFVKELTILAEENPEVLYQYWDRFLILLDGKNKILKWNAIDIIGHLSAVDKNNKIDEVFDKLVSILHSGNMITSNHIIFCFGVIAQHRFDLKRRIIDELVAVRDDIFDTDECRNIAIGKVLEVFVTIKDDIKVNQQAMELVEESLSNTRNSTRKKAEKLLKLLSK